MGINKMLNIEEMKNISPIITIGKQGVGRKVYYEHCVRDLLKKHNNDDVIIVDFIKSDIRFK